MRTPRSATFALCASIGSLALSLPACGDPRDEGGEESVDPLDLSRADELPLGPTCVLPSHMAGRPNLVADGGFQYGINWSGLTKFYPSGSTLGGWTVSSLVPGGGVEMARPWSQAARLLGRSTKLTYPLTTTPGHVYATFVCQQDVAVASRCANGGLVTPAVLGFSNGVGFNTTWINATYTGPVANTFRSQEPVSFRNIVATQTAHSVALLVSGMYTPSSCNQTPYVDEVTVVDLCGNGICDYGYNPLTGTDVQEDCVHDCPVCNDGVCSPSENRQHTCSADCGPYCGDTICEGGETASSCPPDCAY